jgi:hypothetical protein
MNVFYFGCVKLPGGFTSGHHMHRVDMTIEWEFTNNNPWGLRIDGGLCPGATDEKGERRHPPMEEQVEGAAHIRHKDGWTALSFWDRSVDTRGNSNSNFLAEGKHTFEEMLSIAWLHFPEIMGRFKFTIVPAEQRKP